MKNIYVSKLKSSKGFTLIELLVVIAIIALLSSVIIASLNTARAKARDARRFSDIQQINTAIQLYVNAHGGTLPPADNNDDIRSTVPGYTSSAWSFSNIYTNPAGEATTFLAALAPYLPKMPADPCGENCPNADNYLQNADSTGNFFSYEYMYIQGTSIYKIIAQRLESKTLTGYGFSSGNGVSLLLY